MLKGTRCTIISRRPLRADRRAETTPAGVRSAGGPRAGLFWPSNGTIRTRRQNRRNENEPQWRTITTIPSANSARTGSSPDAPASDRRPEIPAHEAPVQETAPLGEVPDQPVHPEYIPEPPLTDPFAAPKPGPRRSASLRPSSSPCPSRHRCRRARRRWSRRVGPVRAQPRQDLAAPSGGAQRLDRLQRGEAVGLLGPNGRGEKRPAST